MTDLTELQTEKCNCIVDRALRKLCKLIYMILFGIAFWIVVILLPFALIGWLVEGLIGWSGKAFDKMEEL